MLRYCERMSASTAWAMKCLQKVHHNCLHRRADWGPRILPSPQSPRTEEERGARAFLELQQLRCGARYATAFPASSPLLNRWVWVERSEIKATLAAAPVRRIDAMRSVGPSRMSRDRVEEIDSGYKPTQPNRVLDRCWKFSVAPYYVGGTGLPRNLPLQDGEIHA